MKSQLGAYIRHARINRRLSPQAVALQLGYSPRGCNKGARRLMNLEEQGVEESDFVLRVLALLEVDFEKAHALAQVDAVHRHQALRRWADEPIEPVLVLSFGPHWFLQRTRPLPETAKDDLAKAEGLVSRFLRRFNRQRDKPIDGHIIWSRRDEVWFDESGNILARIRQTDDELCEQLPRVQIGNKTVQLQVD